MFLLVLLCPLIAGGQSIQLADSLFSKGTEYDERGNMREAEFYYGEAYDIYRQHQDTVSWLEAGKEYASALVYRSKHDEAMELYRMLLEVEHPANDVYNRGDIYNSMGWASRREGELDQAIQFYQKSLPLARESGDSVLIGVVYDNMGSLYSRKGNYSKSLEFRQEAIKYFKGIKDQRRIAITLNNLGHIYKKLLLYDKALEYFHRSLEKRIEFDNVNMLATVYHNIAGVQKNLGNYDQALISYQKSLDYRNQAGDLQGSATTLNNIGHLYKGFGEYDKALDYYHQSLAMSEKISGPASIATTTRNIAKILVEQGEFEQATELLRKVMELRKKAGNPYDIASSLEDMISIEFEAGAVKKTNQYLAELKTIADSTNSYDLLKDAYFWQGEISRRKGDYVDALSHFKKSYAYSQFLPPSRQLGPLKNLARAYHSTGSDSTVIYAQKAVNIIEQHRSNAGAMTDLRTGYFKRHSDFYIDLASWLLTYKQDASGAYRMIELAKARSLSDELAEAAVNIEQKLPEEIRVEQNEKRNRINELYSELESTVDFQEQSSLKKEIREAELDFAAFQNRIRNEFLEFRQVESPEPITLEKAQALNDDSTAVLEYAVSDNHLVMFFISRENVRVEQFSLNSDYTGSLEGEITEWVTGFRDAILSNAPKKILGEQSVKLYEILIRPFEEEISGFKNLVVVPDGALAYLPFEALMKNGRYLVESHHLKYEPSLTSLTLLKESESSENRMDLLAVAGSQPGYSEQSLLRQSSFSALPSTLIEVDSIASNFQHVSTLRDERVSEQALKELLHKNKYRYIHLATHGVIDEEQPHRSGLNLSAGGEVTVSSREDGMLRSSEIYSLDLPSDMVVLSACNTGLGKIVKGEGMLGLQRSFFYAGTSTVVISLWSVYDRSTANFMNVFYKALLEEQKKEAWGWMESLLRWVGWEQSIPFGSRATAMREAKLKMIEHPLFNHPVYWAPFVVVGR